MVSALLGAFLGGGDALLTLVANPDPGLLAFRFGYVLGPILMGVAWASVVGAVAAGLARGARRRIPAVAAGSIAIIWGLSVLVDAGRSGQGPSALAVLAAVTTLGAVALARLAIDLAAALDRLPARRQRAIGLAAGLAVVAGGVAIAPAGFRTVRAGTGMCHAAGAASPLHPNVLLVSVDALRADAAGTMHAYRRLADSGIEYTQHVTASPWTLPSIAALLTGLPPERHGAGRSLSSRSLLAKSPLAGDVRTVAERLAARGYRTHAIVTNPFLTARYGIDRGFCSFANVTMEGEAVRGLGQTAVLRYARAIAPRALPSDRASAIRARAERWLDAAGPEPFFLWLHFLDPHAPYGDRDGVSTSLTLDLMALQDRSGPEVPFGAMGLLRAGEYRPTAVERERIRALYRDDVEFLDRELDRLLDFLDARGLRQRTAVIFTADHGEEFWEHGGSEHGRTLYDEVLRVPLVIVPPGGADVPARRDALTSVLDVAPTILAVAGVAEPNAIERNLLEPAAPSDRALVLGNLLFGEEWTGLRTAAFKYLRSEHGEERLFDLEQDPGERVNRVAALPETLAALRAVASASGRQAATPHLEPSSCDPAVLVRAN